MLNFANLEIVFSPLKITGQKEEQIHTYYAERGKKRFHELSTIICRNAAMPEMAKHDEKHA